MKKYIFDFDVNEARDDVTKYFQSKSKEEMIKFAKDNRIRLFSSKEDRIRETVSYLTYSRLHKGEALRNS